MPLAALPAPEYSTEERERIIDYALKLRKDEIQKFLREQDLPVSGTKPILRQRVEEKLAAKAISYGDLVDLVDRVEPWAQQHVYLYMGPPNITMWRSAGFLQDLLKKHRLSKYLGSKLSLILPQKLTLSSIEHSDNIVRVTAIERRDAWERTEELDDEDITSEGDEIEFRAFVHHAYRGIVSFEWNLRTNHAMIQISQLPSRSKYEDALARFVNLVGAWLPMHEFTPIDLGRGVSVLHTESKTAPGAIRSHGIGFLSAGGRRLLGKSASPELPLLGERVVDTALETVQKNGTGFEGNFYFLGDGTPENPILGDEIHVVIIATRQRVNFPTSNGEDIVRYVLGRIRQACV
jgi:hypothetical protein